MKRSTMAAALAILVVLAGNAAAQPDVGITAPAPTDRPSARPPSEETTRPGYAGDDGTRRGVRYNPVFIGPTMRSETTEFGTSAWIAPSAVTGGPQPGGGDRNGWAALGFTFSWGGPPQRPSGGAAIPLRP